MSYGNCVVANGTPENCEVVADAGVTFQKNNFQQLAGILAGLVNDSAAVKEFGQKARERVMANYSWDSVVEQYIQVIHELRHA
jgi:glycosyltransferase involved in cell wall biosynthesis